MEIVWEEIAINEDLILKDINSSKYIGIEYKDRINMIVKELYNIELEDYASIGILNNILYNNKEMIKWKLKKRY